MSKIKSLDTERFAATIERGSIKELHALRVELVATKNRICSQLELDRADELDERGELVAAGVEPATAVAKAQSETDQNWRARAQSVIRIVDVWLLKVRVRCKELAPHDNYAKSFGAILVTGGATSADQVVRALNTLIERGSKIVSWSTHGSDLVVLASAPPECAEAT